MEQLMPLACYKPNQIVRSWLVIWAAGYLLLVLPIEKLVAGEISGPVGSFVASKELVIDNFEQASINSEIWQKRQLPAGSYWIDERQIHSGKRSLAFQSDPDNRACGGKCERTEVRIAQELQIPFGSDAWYSFSFLLENNTPLRENTRWVSGQWKQMANGSPFLAQRFEHGVFHITVQDNNCRVLVAKSVRERVKIPSTNQSGIAYKHALLEEKFNRDCVSDIVVEQGDDPTLPEPYGQWINMTYHVRGGRNGTGLIEIWSNGKFIARVTGSIGNDKVHGPLQYFKFGIYRDHMQGTGVVYLDNFKREINPLGGKNSAKTVDDLIQTK